ncbi:MAG: hypothetical protein IPL52_05460 [Flavobacteriales bacterium]|nr:hypothetical protein [Flavobacteriales bacterium]
MSTTITRSTSSLLRTRMMYRPHRFLGLSGVVKGTALGACGQGTLQLLAPSHR